MTSHVTEWFNTLSFRWKAILFIATIEGLFNIMFAFIVVGVMQSNLEEQFFKRAEITAQIFASMTANAVLATDIASLESFIDEVMKNKDVIYARVRNTTDVLAERSQDPIYLTRQFKFDTNVSWVDDNVFDTFSVIQIDGENYGQVEVGISTSLMGSSIKLIQLKVILIGAGEILFSAFVSFLLGTFLVRRLVGLQVGARRMAEGEIGVQIDAVGQDELAETAQAFNHMSTTIEALIEDHRAHKNAIDEHAIVSVSDAKGTITYVNDKFCEISGYSRDELLGQNHRILKSGNHSPEFYNNLWKTISCGKPWHGEISNFRKDGSAYWVYATIVPFMNKQGIPFQYIAIRTDITNNKTLEEEAEQANKAKSEFLAAMSHEIRTPMAGVIGMSGLLLETDLTPQQLDWATSIKTSGDNLLDILNEILDQSKLDAGKLELSPTDFHLASLFNDTTHLFDPKIDEKGLTLEVELDDTLPEGAHADRMRIGQVLSNFLSNALKFTETGRIAVRVGHEPLDDGDFMLRIEVTDSGIGLSKEAQGKLFTAFTQADSSTSRTYGGTGLGLSISKQLAEMMGGKIGVDSAEGIGSTFWYTVLCQPAKEKVEASDKRRALDRWMSSRPLKVLVAEDNVVNQQVIMTIFGKLGHEVTVADNGKVASEFVEAEDFDLVLMDIRMPVMDGLDATKLIRAMNNDKSKIPIIALTADIAAGNIVEYTDIGMNDVCAKPLDLPVLLKAINTLFGEEIHTSIPNALSSTPEQEKTNIEDDVEPKGDSTFAQVLVRVGAMVDQASSLGSENAEPPSEMAVLFGDKFSELLANYEQNLTEQCDNLEESVTELTRNPTDRDVKENVKNITHTIKGGGGTFDYNLITAIATKADDLVSENDVLDDDDLGNLRKYSDALKLVAHKKMSGNGGKAGRILLQGLPAKASG